jgi:arylsulfatase
MKAKRFINLMAIYAAFAVLLSVGAVAAKEGGEIVHDAEHYILLEQHGEKWAAENKELDEKLKALSEKYGNPPNIIHIMWDDTGLGDVGDPLFNKLRGYDTPNMNRMADEGMTMARMYTEPSCTPTRIAALTGRLPTRTGINKVLFPPDGMGLPAEEVTLAEVLSDVGYATAMFGKPHMGDIEESYMHNQGFDETLQSLYNQWDIVPFSELGQRQGVGIGVQKDTWDKNYALDQKFRPENVVQFIDAKKGEEAVEWAEGTWENLRRMDKEMQERAENFIRKSAKAKKPFYMAYWPNQPFNLLKEPGEKWTTSAGEGWAERMVEVDGYIGGILAELKAQGIDENTLVVINADNGPFDDYAPNNTAKSVFRGGKGSYLEGGVRVPAFARWPGVIEADSTVGDIIHITDLFTTFARLGGGMKKIPTDRVIDGIDQTALLLNGDTHGRRDYVHIYTGPVLAATVKQQYKKHWLADRPGLPAHSFFDLYRDPREEYGEMPRMIWSWEAFAAMKRRHEEMIEKYPHTPTRHGEPFQGIERIKQ